MKRRQKPEDVPKRNTPLRLFRFVRQEWDAATDLEAAGKWWDARDDWREANGEAAELDWRQPIPDAPFDPRLV